MPRFVTKISNDVFDEDSIFSLVVPAKYSTPVTKIRKQKKGITYRVQSWNTSRNTYASNSFQSRMEADEFIRQIKYRKSNYQSQVSGCELLSNIQFYQTYFRLSFDPVIYPVQHLTLDPYLLGLWLGDGTVGAAEITSIDQPIIDTIMHYASSMDL